MVPEYVATVLQTELEIFLEKKVSADLCFISAFKCVT